MVRRYIPLFITLILSACATTLPGPNPTVVEKDIIRSTLNELCAAILYIRSEAKRHPAAGTNRIFNQFEDNEGWIASVQVNLQTDVEASLAPSATLTGPILPGLLVPKGGGAGTFSAGIGGTLFDQTSTVLRQNTHYAVIATLLNDEVLCPTSERLAYSQGLYENHDKYLTGQLGIEGWLGNAVAAQEFTSLINPTTQFAIVKPNPPADETKKLAEIPNIAVNKNGFPVEYSVKTHSFNFFQAAKKPITCPNVEDPDDKSPELMKQIPDQKLVAGQKYDLPLDFSDPKQLPLKFSATFDGAALPKWITIDPRAGRLFGTAPDPIKGTHVIEATATNSLGLSECETFAVSVVPPPPPPPVSPSKETWGPSYSGTFKFILKGSGQAGPLFSTDKSKGGSTTLFSMTRTETNFVLIALTATGVNLLELPNETSGGGVGVKPLNTLSDSETRSILDGFQRLNDQMLRAQLSHISGSP
jgi:hypothetical protein